MSNYTFKHIFFVIFICLSIYAPSVEAQIGFGGRGGGSGAVTGWPTVSTTKEITWADALANAVQIGDGVTPLCMYTDSTLGPLIRPCTDSDTRTYIWTNFNWCLYDIEGTSCILTVDPDAASTLAMYQFASAYRPRKSIWFAAGSLSTDGTNCAAPTEATPLASSVKLYTIICLDNDSSRMHGSILMPDGYDGGTFTLTALVTQTAADTNVIEYQAAGQCKGDTESLVTTANYGTEVVWTDTMSGSSKTNMATSGAITAAGTCAASDFLAFYVDIGATNTTTAMATVHIIGFKLEYTVTSLSD
jgi:hypothetical protein